MQAEQKSNTPALIVVTFVFFMWGFITALNDILLPHLKSLFLLNYVQAALIQFTFFGTYFIMSLPSGWILSRVGYKRSIVLGLCVTGIGALAFYPAASLESYAVFLGALFILASGITLLQVAANPYVSLLGPEKTSSSRLNLSQAFNSLGTTLAPLFGRILILSAVVLTATQLAALSPPARTAYRAAQSHAVQGPYLLIAATLFVLAAGVYLFQLPELPVEEKDDAAAARHPWLETLKHPQVLYGMAAIFLYVGAEVSIGSFMINYIAMPEIGNFAQGDAANYVALYWGGAMVGRFLGSAILQRVEARNLMLLYACVAAVLALTTILSAGHVAVYSIVAIGLFNSIMFPNIFTFGIDKMGTHTSRASSMLVMAIVGGALVPLAMGALADRIGLHHAFVLPLVCYLYLVFYGAIGSRRVVPAE
ncbi:MAG: sugar MFS transporter [Rhizomicrobium sp.]|jgi:FHS family L-fucose permease-like MFS transporter